MEKLFKTKLSTLVPLSPYLIDPRCNIFTNKLYKGFAYPLIGYKPRTENGGRIIDINFTESPVSTSECGH